MNKLALYFKKVGRKRILASLAGNILVGLGIAIFKFAALGNDPYTGMNMALAETLGIPFPTLQLGVNLLFFLLQFVFARQLIGFGTLFNALFILVIQVIASRIGQRRGTLAAWCGARFILRHDRLVAGPVPGRRLYHQAAAQHGLFHCHHPARFLREGKRPGKQQDQQKERNSFHLVKIIIFQQIRIFAKYRYFCTIFRKVKHLPRFLQ